MTTNRLEAFSDGVLAIIITIMVLELKAPEGADFHILKPYIPKFISYILSFIYVGIYWNNHHHLFQVIEKVNGKVLWANLHLLFWLSLLPVSTAWLGENQYDNHPTALYGFILLMSSIAFYLIEWTAKRFEDKDSKLNQSIRSQIKEYASTLGYLIGIILSFFYPIASLVIYYGMALLWIIPDSRIEKNMANIV